MNGISFGTGQSGIPSASTPTGHKGGPQPRCSQIGHHGAPLISDHRAHRHYKHQIGSLATVAQAAASVCAVAGPAVGGTLVGEKGGYAGVCFDNDVPPTAAGATFRLAARPTSRPAERNNSRSTIAGTQMNGDLVYEHARDRAMPGQPSVRTLTCRRPRRLP